MAQPKLRWLVAPWRHIYVFLHQMAVLIGSSLLFTSLQRSIRLELWIADPFILLA
jgi:hypothetical protein